MDNAEIIADYCKYKLVSNRLFSEYVSNNLNFIFLLLDNRIIDSKTKIKINTIIKLQQNKNTKIEQQIIDIQKVYNDFVGLKGYFIQKAYYPDDYIRLFGDIDILVRMKDGYAFYKLLKKSGYYLKHRETIYRRIIHSDFAISILRGLYTRKNKHIGLRKTNASLLELHTNINSHCPYTCDNSFNIDRMISNSILKKKDDFCFNIFSPEDNLLYLMAHTIEHISYIELHGNSLSINLQKIYDIAQIIDNEEINWNLFLEYAIEYNITPVVSLFIKTMSDIFPKAIPSDIVKTVYNHAQSINFGWKYLFDDIMNLTPEEIILGDYKNLPQIMKCYETAKYSKNPNKIWQNFHMNSMAVGH